MQKSNQSARAVFSVKQDLTRSGPEARRIWNHHCSLTEQHGCCSWTRCMHEQSDPQHTTCDTSSTFAKNRVKCCKSCDVRCLRVACLSISVDGELQVGLDISACGKSHRHRYELLSLGSKLAKQTQSRTKQKDIPKTLSKIMSCKVWDPNSRNTRSAGNAGRCPAYAFGVPSSSGQGISTFMANLSCGLVCVCTVCSGHRRRHRQPFTQCLYLEQLRAFSSCSGYTRHVDEQKSNHSARTVFSVKQDVTRSWP